MSKFEYFLEFVGAVCVLTIPILLLFLGSLFA
jgi:hypothetical protein